MVAHGDVDGDLQPRVENARHAGQLRRLVSNRAAQNERSKSARGPEALNIRARMPPGAPGFRLEPRRMPLLNLSSISD